MNEWGMPISKDKIIARRNRLIEYQKLGELRFTPLYEAIDENILDINYMLYEIDNLQFKINKAIEIIDLITPELWNISNKMTYRLKDVKNILKEDK